MLQNNFHNDLQIILKAVEVSGEVALARFGKKQKIWEKSEQNFVCEADQEIDSILKNSLLGARPDYGWLSEETADDGSRLKCKKTWIVDPIDGTSSYLSGIAEFAISVALVEKGLPIIGVVFNPASNELFCASRGGGASLNGNRIHVSESDPNDSLNILSSRSERRESGWTKHFSKDNVTVVSSIAYKFALVAAGHFDAVASVWPKNDWDICAGHLLVEEAGGTVSNLSGKSLEYNKQLARHNTCTATNGKIHNIMLERLERFDS